MATQAQPAAAAVTFEFRGTRLVLMINNNGVGYGGCPACHPGYQEPTFGQLTGGTAWQ